MRPDLELPTFQHARDYLHHPVLAPRLTAITEMATQYLRAGVPPEVLFGAMAQYDAPKFQEVCTCFLLAARAEALPDAERVFQCALDNISHGKLHEPTVKLAA